MAKTTKKSAKTAVKKKTTKKVAKPKNTAKIYPPPTKGPKVLIFDIETAPIIAHVWGLWENNVGLNQIVKDWHVISWSAKWLDSPESEVMYMDQRGLKKVEDDKNLLQQIWNLLNEADVVITQNGIKFDQRKLNARFVLNGMGKPSSFRHIDTARIAKRHFDFTSYKLAYMTDKLCTKYKKLTHHGKFAGHEMWTECLKDNIEAWQEMEKYNRYDVLSLEELYHVLIAWDSSIDFSVYTEEEKRVCSCGGDKFIKNGFVYTNSAKYQRYQCKGCKKEHRGRINLFSPEKKASLKQ